MIYLTTSQYTILSILILCVSVPLIYLAYQAVMKERKRYKKDYYKHLDDLVKIKTFYDYIAYQMKTNTAFEGSFLLISIDGFQRLSQYMRDDSMTKYLQHFGHRIKCLLPKGGKMAQTKSREIFIVYVKEKMNDEKLYTFASQYKSNLEKAMRLNDHYALNKTVTIAAINDKALKQVEDITTKLKLTLYQGIRDGGNRVICYQPKFDNHMMFLSTYETLKHAIVSQTIQFETMFFTNTTCEEIEGAIVLPVFKESVLGHDMFQKQFMLDLETSHDDYWFSQWMLESGLTYYQEYIRTINKAHVPVVIFIHYSQLTHPQFIEQLTSFIYQNRLKTENMILRVFHIDVEQAKTVYQHVRELKSLGIQFALDYTKNVDHLKQFIDMIDPELMIMNSDDYQHFESIHHQPYASLTRAKVLLTQVDTMSDFQKDDQHIYGLFGKVAEKVINKDEWVIYKNKKNHGSRREK